MQILILTDYLLSDLEIVGGAEYNDKILFNLLEKDGHSVAIKRSREVNVLFLKSLQKETKVIVSNFVHLDNKSKLYLQNNFDYLIYEHDHKYLEKRNPSSFVNFEAPKEKIINYDFYKSARAVLAQTNFHKKIIEKNLKLKNIISLSGNLWDDSDFDKMEKLLSDTKNNRCSILHSSFNSKGTQEAIYYCENNNLDYDLISDNNYYSFLRKIASNEKLVFLPTTPETLSRVCVEARMMGCTVVTNGLVGAKYEEWFKLKGKDLIDYLRSFQSTVVETIIRIFEDIKDKKITVILNSYRRPYNLKMQVEAIKKQTVQPTEIWLWVNDHEDNRGYDYSDLGVNKIFHNDHNWKFYGRFAAALLSDTEYVAIFDDDTIPGERWFENCLETMKTKQGILGSAGVILNSKIYMDHRRSGWAARNEEIERVDLVGHAWFFKREWLQYLWKEKPPTWDNGEDIQFSYAAQRYGNVQTYCPPHPPSDKSLHGSILGNELGIDSKATSNNNQVSHQQFFSERDMCVQYAIKNGWDTVKSVKL